MNTQPILQETQKEKIVLLVQPDEASVKPRMPLGLLYVAHALLKNKHKTQIIDLRIRKLEDYKIDWAGVLCVGINSFTFESIKHSLAFAKQVREKNPGIPIIWGGIHASMVPVETAKHELVDIVVKGDGENVFVELIEKLKNNEDWSNIRGIIFKDNNGKIHVNDEREYTDLNEYFELPYEILEMEKYNNSPFPINTSRGCPYPCIFCYNLNINKKSYRTKSADTIIREIEYLMKTFNAKSFSFADDNFFMIKGRVEEFCNKIIEKGIAIEWIAPARLDYLPYYSAESMQLLKKSGCFQLSMGAESGSQKMLDFIKKGIKVQHIYDSVEKCKEAGITPVLSFVWGFPTETWEDTLETLKCIEKVKKIYDKTVINGLFSCTVYPGTTIAEIASSSFGLKLPETLEEWAEFRYFDPEKCPWLEKNYINKMEIISTIIRFQFLNNIDSKSFFKNYALRKIFEITKIGLSLSAKLRLKFGFTAIAPEWKLWKKITTKYIGY